METNRLRQFCVVCETGNLRKAAEILGLSHSALSKSLKVLQGDLQKNLLAQSGRNIVITDAGRDFLPKAKRFLEAEGELLKEQVKRDQVVRIGTFEVFSTHVLGQRWGTYFPGQDLELHELVPGEMEGAVASGIVDYGLTYEPIPTSGLEFLALGKVQMKIFVRKGAFAGVASPALPFVAPIIPVSGAPSGVKGLDGWPDHEIPRQVKFKVGMMESGLALARSGEAAIFLPPFVASHHNRSVKKEFQLEERPLPKGMKPVERKVYLVIRKSTEESPRAKRLGALIRKECLAH